MDEKVTLGDRIRVQCTQIGWSYITRIGLLAGRFLGEELVGGHSRTFWNKVKYPGEKYFISYYYYNIRQVSL